MPLLDGAEDDRIGHGMSLSAPPETTPPNTPHRIPSARVYASASSSSSSTAKPESTSPDAKQRSYGRFCNTSPANRTAAHSNCSAAAPAANCSPPRDASSQ